MTPVWGVILSIILLNEAITAQLIFGSIISLGGVLVLAVRPNKTLPEASMGKKLGSGGDIDGTLANIEHRRVYLDSHRPDWARFNAMMGEDTPNGPIVDLYKTLWKSGTYDLQIVTGRNEAFRKVEGRDIAFAVDDRQQVVDMWRANGVTCLQCDVGDF